MFSSVSMPPSFRGERSRKALPDLPVRAVLPDIARALDANRPVVLQAPPGSGKTLLVAPSLLDAPWLEGRRIVLLEPRRLAARAAARYMARMLGETVGERVGYQVRLERKIGAATRIEILTEGLLVQRLLNDPGLADTALIICDEFHERSLAADLSLALTLDLRTVLRPDLRVLVMSATLDAQTIAQHLGDRALVVTADARVFPVETRYLSRPAGTAPIPHQAAQAVARALERDSGGILVFLPGEGEIRRAANLLRDMRLPSDVDIHPLFGALPRHAQDAAVEPAPPGRRKVVLATSIAESSLTIQDIRVVIDCGWMRVPRFSVRNGMSRLETLRITRDRADQRRGRAGRVAPGVCYRLWDEATDRQLAPQALPEILDADLAPLRLQCADWGCADREGLPWLTAPPDAAWRLASELLKELGALDDDGRLTPHGRELARLPVHPRLAHMIRRGAEAGCPRRACLMAAAIEEAAGEASLRHETDARRLLDRLDGDTDASEGRDDWARRVHLLANQWGRRYPALDRAGVEAGRLLAWAYPDRVAQRRERPGQFRMVNGHGAVLDPEEGIATAPWLAVAELQDAGSDGRIRLAAPVPQETIEEDFADLIRSEDVVQWDRSAERVAAWRRRRLGALVLGEGFLSAAPPARIQQALFDGIRIKGVANLGWTAESRNLQARILFIRRACPDDPWPDVSDAALMDRLPEWLDGWLDGCMRWEHMRKVDLCAPLRATLGNRVRQLDVLAPTHWPLPGGGRAPIRYDQGEQPVLAVRLQDLFGVTETPRLAGGRVAVVCHLLSPARRPIAVTADLASFWKQGYPLVRREYRGRYPKHAWPENPFA